MCIIQITKRKNKTITAYIFLEAPTATRLPHNNPAILNALPAMASLGAPVIPTRQHLLTGGPTHLHRSITRHSFIHPLPTRACSLPLQWTLTTLPRMTPLLTNMLPTRELLLTRLAASKNTITALPLLSHLPTLAATHGANPARRARTTVANLNAPVNPTIQQLGTRIFTGKLLEPASSNVLV